MDSAEAEAAAAAAAAAATAFRDSTIEGFTLYAFGVLVTCLRTYSRLISVGITNLRADDFLIWVAILIYTAQTTLAYHVGSVAHGLANSGMTDAERAALSPSDAEYQQRVIGSQIQVAGWTTYATLTASLKYCMLIFYIRLTEGLSRRYRIHIHVGFFLVTGTLVASLFAIYLGCRPFEKNWQIYPDPGNACQPAIAEPVVWATFTSNVVTDLYLIFIPLPLLWGSSLKLIKKIMSTILLSAGVFVLVCATLKLIFVLADPVHGAELAGAWGTRETFVAVCTTNLPMIYPLLRIWFRPVFGSTNRSSAKTYKTPSGFQTIGGGNSTGQSRNRRVPPRENTITANFTFSESEERIVNDVKMQNLRTYAMPIAGTNAPHTGIVVSSDVEVTTEDRSSHHGEPQVQRVHETW